MSRKGLDVDVYTLGEVFGVLTSGRIRHEHEARLDVTGAELTVAIGLTRLGHTVSWLGKVGADELGVRILSVLRGEGVDVSDARVDESAPTGMILKEARTGQASKLTYYPTAVRLAQGNVPVDRVTQASILHVSGITAALNARDAMNAAVRTARTAGVPVSVSVDYDERLWPDLKEAEEVLNVLACAADVLFVRQCELDLVKPALAGDREVIVNRGTRGASVRVNGVRHDAPGLGAPVVDPGGSSAAFVAGYLSALLERLHPADRLRRGALLAAFAASGPSDWQSLPTRDELPLLDLDK
ncbi:sugar kinase [Planobispora longispora]|uniref:Sugar kinase n=1 Tax=Planobispora longispora TaxID=28887 RepID=A0A8J3RDZ2_9ACTN|nr:sugar kinase [Planobispora longispora]BFE86645.1 sugar kinase [Planobispora longispora]GIH74456.1 sugar kinase [Planobispora longispora]